jgi:hypothetical protein
LHADATTVASHARQISIGGGSARNQFNIPVVTFVQRFAIESRRRAPVLVNMVAHALCSGVVVLMINAIRRQCG